MRLESKLSKRAYIAAMKDRMEGHLDFGKERFTGFFFGPVFSVTYHSGFEWNRRYTSQKNTAIGIVKKGESGCTVSCICLKGALAPTQFIPLYLLIWSMLVVPTLWTAMPIPAEDLAVVGKAIGFLAALSFVVVAVSALIGALIESFTEKSIEGGKILRAFLLSPDDPFSYINNKNKV